MLDSHESGVLVQLHCALAGAGGLVVEQVPSHLLQHWTCLGVVPGASPPGCIAVAPPYVDVSIVVPG